MNTARVLIVDDEAGMRQLLRALMLLNKEVFAIAEARDGAEAVAVAQEFHPDVVVLDYHMPEMDGDAAARRIKQLRPETRIVAFSCVVDDLPEWADGFCRKEQVAELGRHLFARA